MGQSDHAFFVQLDLLNPGHQSCNHKVYALTCEQYERLLKRAGGRCEMCGRPGFLSAKGRLAIDHDHELGWWAVRGLLCNRCNTQFRRSWMAEARAQYLPKAWHLTKTK